jgi:RNA polymerase sigma-70 factor (ECF subfamily)
LNGHSDKNLVAASQTGDKSAYALLVKRFYKHIFIVCLGVVGNVEDAEDAAQEAMLKGFVKIGKLRDSSQFGPWLTRIAKNLCINLVRRKQRTKEIMAEKATQPKRTPSNSVSLQQAIENLPMEIRQPLVMYYFNGQSVENVASNLNISTSGVYSKLRTAIKELHGLLSEQGDING